MSGMPELLVKVSQDEKKSLEEAANKKGKDLSIFIHEVLIKELEDEHDHLLLEEARKEYQNDPVSYTNDEVMEMFHGKSWKKDTE